MLSLYIKVAILTVERIELINKIKLILYRFFKPVIHIAAFIIKTFDISNISFNIFERKGFFLLRKHYYLPIPNDSDIEHEKESKLVGISIDVKASLKFLEKTVTKYKPEFNKITHEPNDDSDDFYLINGTFMSVDSDVYYGLVRNLSPKKIIEVGGGNSTKLALEAIKKNKKKTNLTCIEPYPSKYLLENKNIRLLKKRVQEIPIKTFENLNAGDILFIDSTHVLKSGGDVWWLYCEILPRLKTGVFVHVHDISLPSPYPKVYRDNHWYWNEQYLLQAFLTFNNKFKILWPGSYIFKKYPRKMKRFFDPGYSKMRKKYPSSGPGSFWMKVGK